MFSVNPRHPPGVRICFEGAGIIGALTRSTSKSNRPVGLMDKASASGAGDSRLESWAGHFGGTCLARPEVAVSFSKFIFEARRSTGQARSGECGARRGGCPRIGQIASCSAASGALFARPLRIVACCGRTAMEFSCHSWRSSCPGRRLRLATEQINMGILCKGGCLARARREESEVPPPWPKTGPRRDRTQRS